MSTFHRRIIFVILVLILFMVLIEPILTEERIKVHSLKEKQNGSPLQEKHLRILTVRQLKCHYQL